MSGHDDLRKEMVDRQIHLKEQACRDCPVPIDAGQAISQPRAGSALALTSGQSWSFQPTDRPARFACKSAVAASSVGDRPTRSHERPIARHQCRKC
jgi:hypothetical protein